MDSLTLLNGKYRQDSGDPAQHRSCVTTPDNESEDNSSDCCFNVVPPEVEVAPAMHQKPLPSFYIERLLQPTTSSAQNGTKATVRRHARDSSTVTSESSSSSHRSSPVSAGQTSPASERDWCVSPYSLKPDPAHGTRMVGAQDAMAKTSNVPKTPAVAIHDQSEPRSTTVFIAWPDGEARGVNFNRLQRELLSHHGLFSYGSWIPERGTTSLQEFQPHQLDLSLTSIAGASADRQYFNMQGSTLSKRYRKQNRERKPRQAYSAMQLERLEDEFKRSIYLNVSKRFELAQCLGLSETQIKTWFQNRRTKFKKQQDSRNKREQRQHAQLIAQWLLQPQLCGDAGAGQFHPRTRLPVLLPPRPVLHHSTLMPSPYLLPAPVPSQHRQNRPLLESQVITVPVTVRSPNGPPAALPLPASFPTRILTTAGFGGTPAERGIVEGEASTNSKINASVQ